MKHLTVALLALLSTLLTGTASAQAPESADLTSALQRIEQLEQQVDQLSIDQGSIIQAGYQLSGASRCSGSCGADPAVTCGSSTCGASSNGVGTPNLYATYDRGFVLRPYDATKTPFEMKINSWFQLRHSVLNSDGPNPDQNDIEFERSRLIFRFHSISEYLEYFLQIDGDDDQAQRLDVLDFYISYDVGADQLGLDDGRLSIRAGRWKLPFNRTRYTSGLNLQFADRSMSSVFFDIDRSVGIGLFGKEELLGKTVNWETAMFNGIRTNGLRPGRQGELDRNLGVSGRVFSDLIGDWGTDEESDLSWHDELAVRIGAGFAFSREDASDGPAEFGRVLVVDSGQTLASALPGADEYNLFLYAVSADMKYQGWSLMSEYYFRSVSEISGAAVPDLLDHGFLLQTGYFIVPERLEVMARWSRIVGNSGTLGMRDQSADEVAGGIACYFKGRNLKLVFDATHVNSSPINDRAVGFLPGDDGMLYRTQLQFLF
ncbi:MAG: hypothetical protein O3B86_14515 [Planctomycetota bacterium]|nr:hypothetical protein [Planctomycetota bacterium]